MTKTKQGESIPHVEGFARGLKVIEAFGSGSRRLTVSEVARRADVDRAVSRRLLHTLVSLGYAETDGKKFELTSRILKLGFSYLSSLDFGGRVQPFLDELSRSVMESVSITVRQGDQVVYVARSDASDRRLTFEATTGQVLPALYSASGRVLLSQLPDDEIRDLIAAKPLERFTDKTIVDPNRLFDVIMDAREVGWAIVEEELEPGLIAMSTLIRSRSGAVIGGLNISSHKSRTDYAQMREEILPALQAQARSLELVFP